MSRVTEAISVGARAIAAKQYAEAAKFASEVLNEEPDNPPMLAILGEALLKTDRYYEATLVLEKLIALKAKVPFVWGALAKSYAEIAPFDHSFYDKCKQAAVTSIETDTEDSSGFMTLSYAALNAADYENAFHWAKKGMERNPDSRGNLYNSATPMLFNHMWREGWRAYEASLVARYKFGTPEYNVPLWEGQPGKLIVAGEQGLGDEIMFSSMISEIQKTHEIVIDTVPPLMELFRSTFDCPVYGTRHDNDAEWKSKTDADYWVPMANLGPLFRNEHEDFPGTPYIKPDPERKIQWGALLDSLSDKPKIGIAWSGGVPRTQQERRSLTLDQIKPILEYDAEWISLQYKDTGDMPDFVHHWDRAAIGVDYGETAALISELDLFISVTTSAVHCAGSVGTRTWCMVPEKPSWRYGSVGDRMVWYNSVELLRQEQGIWPIQQVCERLSAMGIEKCRDLSTKTRFTIAPEKNSPNWLPPSLQNAGLARYLITGLAKAA